MLNGVDRDGLKTFLAENDVPAMIYYPIPLHKQKAFELSDSDRSFSVTENLCANVISLPIHTEMEAEQQDYVIENVKLFLVNKLK